MGAATVKVHELLLIVVIEDDVGADNGLDCIFGPAGDGADGGVVEGENCDGAAAIDLVCKLGFGDVVIEGTEFWVLAKESRDVEGLNARTECQQNRQAEK